MKKRILGIIPVIMLATMCAGGAKPAESSAENSGGMMTLDQALKEAAIRIDERLVAKTKIAPLNFNSPHDKFSGYVLDEVTANLVDSGKLTVVDRKEVDLIRGEFDFQFSGDVRDDSMQELGRMLGAQSIISGSLTDMGEFYRVVIRVLNVQNASVEVQYRANIISDTIMTALLTGGKTTVAAATPRQTPSYRGTGSTSATTAASSGGSAVNTVKTPPPVPENLKTGAVDATSVALTWTISVPGVSYRIYYSTSADDARATLSGNVNGTAYTVANLQRGTPYYFWVTAVEGILESAKSKAVSATTSNTFKIGDKGPAGGFIFYDKGNSSDGWRYLEAAPSSTEQKDIQWSVSEFSTGAKGIEIGTGKLNTRNIMDSSVQAAINAPAARYCDRLEYGGYDDWYLPSKNELGLMYMNLKVDGIGGFGAGWYRSSTEFNERGAWVQRFSDGYQSDSIKYDGSPTKGDKGSVRAIRQF